MRQIARHVQLGRFRLFQCVCKTGVCQPLAATALEVMYKEGSVKLQAKGMFAKTIPTDSIWITEPYKRRGISNLFVFSYMKKGHRGASASLFKIQNRAYYMLICVDSNQTVQWLPAK